MTGEEVEDAAVVEAVAEAVAEVKAEAVAEEAAVVAEEAEGLVPVPMVQILLLVPVALQVLMEEQEDHLVPGKRKARPVDQVTTIKAETREELRCALEQAKRVAEPS